MARPAKPVGMTDGHRTKKEISERTAAENTLKGKAVSVPQGLTGSQKKICRHIIAELKASEILCSLDKYVLEQCCVAADCLHKINEIMNCNEDAMFDKSLLVAKKEHERTFFRCCSELCLSPQARAKIAAANAAAKDDSLNAIKEILAGNDNDDEDEE